MVRESGYGAAIRIHYPKVGGVKVAAGGEGNLAAVRGPNNVKKGTVDLAQVMFVAAVAIDHGEIMD